MTTLTTSVTSSTTYNVYANLLELGFQTSLHSAFAYSYNRDNNYLSIFVKNAEERLNELYEAARGMEILLVKSTNDNVPFFEIRKLSEYAELIKDEIWIPYYKTISA